MYTLKYFLKYFFKIFNLVWSLKTNETLKLMLKVNEQELFSLKYLE